MKQTIQAYIKDNRFNKLNAESRGLDSSKNYSGPGSEWVVVKGISRSRDTEDCVPAASNFVAALELLGGESTTVEITRTGHWGCGWFELIQINPKDKKSIKIARDISASLDNYPILDETAFCEAERAYQLNYAKNAAEALVQAISIHFGMPELVQSQDAIDFAIDLNIMCQEYYGNDSCINLYACREPDQFDMAQFETCVSQIMYNLDYQDNPVTEFFVTAMGGFQ